MNSQVNRRFFSAVATGAMLGLSKPVAAESMVNPTLDIHVHLFGVGDSGSDCHVAEKVSRGFLFRHLKTMLKLNDATNGTVDQQYEQTMVMQVAESELSMAAVLAQDAVYGANGKIDLTSTSIYVPNDYLFEVVGRHPKQLIACPSINPNRADAIDELDRCHDRKARMLKIHPPTQNVDLMDPKHTRFFRRCRELDMTILVHTGHEHSAPIFSHELAAPRKLRAALEEGCRVVACHAGSGWFSDSPSYLGDFLQLLDKFPELWGDTSVLGTAFRAQDFGRLLDSGKDVLDRLLHGSDFPFPASPVVFADRIGQDTALKTAELQNLIQRDFALKKHLGIGEASALRSHRVVIS
tara:strand:+ start:15008 stop:16063 length:1056 start_codon:yes stop_codon:yes gene_type:complete